MKIVLTKMEKMEKKHLHTIILKYYSFINYLLVFSYISINELAGKKHQDFIWGLFLLLFLSLFSLKIWQVLIIEKSSSSFIKIIFNLFIVVMLMLVLYGLL